MMFNQMVNCYLLLSFGLFGCTFYAQYDSNDNIFALMLKYLSDPRYNLIFYNILFAITVFLHKLIIILFFTELKQNQMMNIMEKLYHKLIVLLVYLSNITFNFTMYLSILGTILFITLNIHSTIRANYLVHIPSSLNFMPYYRLLACFCFLVFMDFQILRCVFPFFFNNTDTRPAFFFLFMLDSFLYIVDPTIHFIVDFYEKFTLGYVKGSQNFLALVTLVLTCLRIVVNVIFIIWIYHYSFSLYLSLYIFLQIFSLGNPIKAYTKVKKLTASMQNLKKISEQQLRNLHDLTCMICFQDVRQAIMLPCQHFFHQECLRQWIVRNSNYFCPKCKKQMNFDATKTQNINQQNHEKQIKSQEWLQSYMKKGQKQQQKVHSENDKINHQQEQKENVQMIKQNNNQSNKQIQNEVQPQVNSNKQFIKKQQKKQQKINQNFNDNLNSSKIKDKNRKKRKIGCLPYNIPTEAIYQRKKADMKIRNSKINQIQLSIKIFQQSYKQQLLLIGE